VEGRARLRQARFYNDKARSGPTERTRSFMRNRCACFVFDFGNADDALRSRNEVSTRMWPSLAVQPPGTFGGPGGLRHVRLLMAFFPGDVHRFLGRGAVCGHDVDFWPLLHYWRSVRLLQDLESRAISGYSSAALSNFSCCRCDWGISPASVQRTLVPHDLPREMGKDYVPHRARQRSLGNDGDVPACAENG